MLIFYLKAPITLITSSGPFQLIATRDDGVSTFRAQASRG